MIEQQDTGITIVNLGGNHYAATVMKPGNYVNEIVLEFALQTDRSRVLDTPEEVIACGETILGDEHNLSLFANGQVVNPIVPILIDSDVCINGIAGLGDPNPLAQTTEPVHINWGLVCGIPTVLALSAAVGAHFLMKRLQLGHISKPEPTPPPPGPIPVYTTAQQRENIEASLVELGIPGDQIFVDPDGTIVSRNPLLGNVPMAQASADILRFSDDGQKQHIRQYYDKLGVKIYDGYLPDGVTGALLVYETDKEGQDIGTPVAIYDPELSRFLPPSNHQQP